MPLTQTVAPTEEPVSLEDAKNFLRISGDDQDDQIAAYLVASRQYAEAYTNRQFCAATFSFTLGGFGPFLLAGYQSKLFIPRPPLISVTSITYLDLDGNTQTLASSVYQVVNDQEGSFVCLAYNQYWPAIRWQPEAVTITYTAGYGAAAAVPAAIRQSILILLRGWYDDCGCTSEENMPMAVKSLLGVYKVWDLEWGSSNELRHAMGDYRVYQANELR